MSPKRLVKTPAKTPRKSDPKNKVKKLHKNESTPEQQNTNVSLSSVTDFFSPPKSNSDFYDTSHLDDFEVINMVHCVDDILDLDNVKLPHLAAVDPLSMKNSIDCKSNVKKEKSPIKMPVTKSRRRKSNRSSRASLIVQETPAIEMKSKNHNRKSKPISFKNEDFSSSEDEKKKDLVFKEINNVHKQERLSPKIVKKLENLEIVLTHKVPRQHKIENNAGTYPPTELQKKLFKRFEILVTGKFSAKEDDTIKNNWKSFCEVHEWDVENVQPFLYMRHQGKCYINKIEQRIKFVQFLANELPSRTLYSVYQRFRFLFAKHHVTKGRFSPEEDKKIMLYMKYATDSNKQFVELAKILGRTVHSIWMRCQVLKNKLFSNSTPKKRKTSLTTVTWTVPLITKFLQNLMKLTLSADVIDLKNAFIPKVVWKEMQKKMSISENLLKNFWLRKLHMQLFSPEPIFLNDVKIKLIEYFHESEISDLEEIVWENPCRLFDGMTPAFICEIFYRLVKHVERKKIAMNLTETVDYLYNVMIPRLKNQPKDKCLPRISFNGKTIQILEEDKDLSTDFLKEGYEEDSLPKRRRLSTFNEKNIELKVDSGVTWTLLKREKFVKILLDLTISKDIKELKNAIIPEVIWEEMEKKLNVDRNELCTLWHEELHLQLFSPSPIYMNDLMIRLIELVYEEEVTDVEKIVWPKICCHLDGMTPLFISKVFFNLMVSACKEINSENFCDIIGYLHKTIIPKLKNQPNDKFLPRFTFENGRMRVLVEEFQEDETLQGERSSSNFGSGEELEDDKEIRWTLPKRENFIKKLLVVSYSTVIQELKDAIIPNVVWNEMEKQMNIDKQILKELWYFELHMQLFCQEPIFLNDVRIKLIEYFHGEKITDRKHIDWPNVCKYFDGFTTIFLIKVFYHLVHSASKEINSDNLRDIVVYLYEKKLQSLKDKGTDKILPRLSYNGGSVKIMEEDIKKEI